MNEVKRLGCGDLSPVEWLDTKRVHPYSEDMEVHFSPEQEAQLSRVASHAGMDAALFVKESALRRVEERNRFSAAVRAGIAQADEGELVEDDEVRVWLEQQERS
jgi:predicted transcriptional regulator